MTFNQGNFNQFLFALFRRTHTFKTIPPTTQPTTTTTPAPPSTSTPLHSFPAYDRYDHSKNCPCKYSQSLDADERITMDKGTPTIRD